VSRRILALPVDDARGASTRYRVLAYGAPLAAAGLTLDVRFPLDAFRGGALRRGWRAADLVLDALRPVREDLLLVHRKTYPHAFAARLRRRGRPFIFDFDDAIDLPPPRRAADEATVARYRDNFVATVEQADLVLCGNAELAARVPHERTALLPTPVDTERFRPGAVAAPGGPTLGWVGHSDNLPYLERLADPLRALAARHPGLRLVVVADRPPALAGIDVEFRPWSLGRELSGFDGIAVGLMPLDDTPWARSKCAFKALQYMALGIPAVASPVGMNSEVLTDGVDGFLPETPERWLAVLDALLRDPELRRRIGAAGRRTVEQRYSVSATAPRLLAAVERLLPR
jgi:glycosyltransferase involved in cell wall biosynthesis